MWIWFAWYVIWLWVNEPKRPFINNLYPSFIIVICFLGVVKLKYNLWFSAIKGPIILIGDWYKYSLQLLSTNSGVVNI